MATGTPSSCLPSLHAPIILLHHPQLPCRLQRYPLQLRVNTMSVILPGDTSRPPAAAATTTMVHTLPTRIQNLPIRVVYVAVSPSSVPRYVQLDFLQTAPLFLFHLQFLAHLVSFPVFYSSRSAGCDRQRGVAGPRISYSHSSATSS
jgi:hypothetical protein